jgi:DNA helicase-2/ATP-dependent DNA helicase PcrA
MQLKCGFKPLNLLLKEHIPEYLLYKEVDLIIGDEKIVISTVHKAKGLEFENVIIPECVNDVYPSWSSKTFEEIKEDARTLYVAMSRAMKRLIITTHSESVNKYGKSFPRHRSSFIDCIYKYFTIIKL